MVDIPQPKAQKEVVKRALRATRRRLGFSFQCSRPFGTLFRSVASKVSSCNNEELTTDFVLQMDQTGPECYTDPTYFQPCGKCTRAPTNVEIAAGKVCS